jgi:predicted RNase H-like HicB family nuclease
VAEPAREHIEVWQEDEWYLAKDPTTGVTTQGKTRSEALRNLAEAIALHDEPIPDDLDAKTPDAPWFET